MSRVAVPLVVLLVLASAAGCRDDSGGEPPLTNQPGPAAEHRLDDIESTLDRIESELSEG